MLGLDGTWYGCMLVHDKCQPLEKDDMACLVLVCGMCQAQEQDATGFTCSTSNLEFTSYQEGPIVPSAGQGNIVSNLDTVSGKNVFAREQR